MSTIADVTVSQFGRNLSPLSKRLLGVAIILVILIGAWIWYDMYSSNHNKAANAVKADNQVYASLQTLTTADSAAGKYGQAAAAWVSYAKTSPNKSHRAYAWQTAASLYMSEANYSGAANGYQKAASITGLTYADAAGAAAAFVRLGNKQQGIYYLQKALQLLPADELDRGSQQQEYSQEITSLRQTQ